MHGRTPLGHNRIETYTCMFVKYESQKNNYSKQASDVLYVTSYRNLFNADLMTLIDVTEIYNSSKMKILLILTEDPLLCTPAGQG